MNPAAGSESAVPLGVPIANTRVYVLDRDLKPVPLGVPGELYVAGEGLARGYVGRAAMTAERFVPEPFGRRGARMYRTGDVVRQRVDGVLEYVGRSDHEVKLRGMRVALGEVEAGLKRCLNLRHVVVVASPDRTGDNRLVAYVTAAEAGDRTPALLRGSVHGLPAHMVPSAFVVLEAMPLTPSGRISRLDLPIPDEAALVSPDVCRACRRAPRGSPPVSWLRCSAPIASVSSTTSSPLAATLCTPCVSCRAYVRCSASTSRPD